MNLGAQEEGPPFFSGPSLGPLHSQLYKGVLVNSVGAIISQSRNKFRFGIRRYKNWGFGNKKKEGEKKTLKRRRERSWEKSSRGVGEKSSIDSESIEESLICGWEYFEVSPLLIRIQDLCEKLRIFFSCLFDVFMFW